MLLLHNMFHIVWCISNLHSPHRRDFSFLEISRNILTKNYRNKCKICRLGEGGGPGVGARCLLGNMPFMAELLMG